MASKWYQIFVYWFLFQSFLGLFMTPQFNLWDKANPNGTFTYFNKTNSSWSNFNESEAAAYYGYTNESNKNVSIVPNMISIKNFDEGGIIGILVAVLTVVLQMLLFVISAFIGIYTGVYTILVQIFGEEIIPFALMIQGVLDIVYTYGFLQLLTARPGRTYD